MPVIRLGSLSILAFSLVLAAGCGAEAVRVAHRSSVEDPHEYRTYAVLEHPVNRGELDRLLEAAIHEAMAERGYARAEAGRADLLVTYGVLLGHADGARGTGREIVTSNLRNEPDAPARPKTLVVILQEAGSGRVVWVGVSNTHASDTELRARTTQAISEVSARIPRARPAS